MEKIQIQCTACKQKFEVTESYKGKMVECGACDHRFKVSGAAIITKKKRFYPGEKAQQNAEHFSKAPVSHADLQDDTKTNYATKFDVARLTPLSPVRKLCISIGVFLLLATIGVFIAGGPKGAFLQDMLTDKRFIIAGFITAFGVALIMFGAKARRAKALLFCLLLGGSLMAMPYIFPHKPNKVGNIADDSDEDKDKDANEAISVDEYKESVGFGKIEQLRAEHEKGGNDPLEVKAVVLRNISMTNLDVVIQYIKDSLLLEDEPSKYLGHRSLDDRPIVLLAFTAPNATDEELQAHLANIGTTNNSHAATKELNLTEIIIDDRIFNTVDPNKLSDESDVSFFYLNHKELHSIDRDRRFSAVQRIRRSKELGMKADIIARLNNMISPADIELSNEVILTLKQWTEPEYNSDEFIKAFATKLSKSSDLPSSALEYLIEKKVPGISSILANQWASPNGGILLEKIIISAGKEGELAIIEALPKVKGAHIRSGANILEKIGSSAEAETVLSGALIDADEQDKKILKDAIDAVRSRR